MRITNVTGLPDAIVEAVKNDGYSRGVSDVSVTTLIGPARKGALEELHGDEIVQDASDLIWILMGHGIHTALERANRKGIAERRLSITVEGWKVSGGMDLYDENGVLVDYKTTSAWSCKGGIKDEWEKQLNCYAEILRQNGHPVAGLKIVAILRDWSKLEAARSADYPQSQVVTFEVPLWPEEQARNYIRERVILHQQARVSLPECTPEERWQKSAVYALMKQGGKRAVKLYDNEADAQKHASTSPSLYVQVRPGENTRCRFYCSVSKFCTQANQTSNEDKEDIA